MTRPNQLLSLCWGSMENVPLDVHIKCAANVGFDAITTSPGAYTKAIRNGHTDQSIIELLDECNVYISGIDPVLNWVEGSPQYDGDEDFAIASRMPVEECARISRNLNCSILNVPPGLAEADLDTFISSFQKACDIGASYGQSMALEFLPFSLIKDLATAWEVVDAADRPNGGIMLDVWHFFQSGGQLADLAKVPIDRIFAVQLNGVKKCPPEEWIKQSMVRLQANEGDFNVNELVRELQRLGLDIIYDVEVFSEELRSMAPQEAAQLCYTATRAMLDDV